MTALEAEKFLAASKQRLQLGRSNSQIAIDGTMDYRLRPWRSMKIEKA
jgi:hypothetical protein